MAKKGAGEIDVRLGDWLDLAGGLAARSVDFVYADPPFNTGRRHVTPPGAGKRRGKEVDGVETGRTPVARDGVGGEERRQGRDGDGGVASYEDSWESMGAYISWLRARVVAIVPAVKATGSVAVHCDYRASHRVRVMMDEVLGEENFVNHLIWRYGLGGSSPRRFARKHDDILVYSMEPDGHYFEAPMVPATSRRMKGQMKKATDVLDVASINNMAGERTGYPTQKPLELLELLVGAFCPLGGLVLDPCCGSGTALAAAARLGRRGIGFDVSEAAVRVARGRARATDGPRSRSAGGQVGSGPTGRVR